MLEKMPLVITGMGVDNGRREMGLQLFPHLTTETFMTGWPRCVYKLSSPKLQVM